MTSDVGDGRIQWYAFFALPPGTKRAPSGWGGSERGDQADPEENLVEYIKSLHEGWTDEIMEVLDATPPESVEQRDLYDRAPELLRSWADGNVVLIGDAVHPMMPNLGQGGCQSIEDAYVLTETLAAVKSTDRVQDSLQEFYRKRILRVTVVQFLSRLASDLIINAFDTPWSPHDNKGQSWKSYLTFFWKVRLIESIAIAFVITILSHLFFCFCQNLLHSHYYNMPFSLHNSHFSIHITHLEIWVNYQVISKRYGKLNISTMQKKPLLTKQQEKNSNLDLPSLKMRKLKNQC